MLCVEECAQVCVEGVFCGRESVCDCVTVFCICVWRGMYCV